MSAIASQITGVSIVVQTQIKENIRAPRHWPLSREFTGDREFLAQRTSNAENVSIWWRHNEIFMPARNLHAASPWATHGWSKITDSTRNASTCWSIYYTTSTSWWQENRPIADTQLPMVCTNAATVAKHYLHRNLWRKCQMSSERHFRFSLNVHSGNFVASVMCIQPDNQWFDHYSISQEICTRFLLCCALLWLYIDWFSHIHQAYFTGTVAI